MIKQIHDFLNGHWEFFVLVSLLSSWLHYRAGYKRGLGEHPQLLPTKAKGEK